MSVVEASVSSTCWRISRAAVATRRALSRSVRLSSEGAVAWAFQSVHAYAVMETRRPQLGQDADRVCRSPTMNEPISIGSRQKTHVIASPDASPLADGRAAPGARRRGTPLSGALIGVSARPPGKAGPEVWGGASAVMTSTRGRGAGARRPHDGRARDAAAGGRRQVRSQRRRCVVRRRGCRQAGGSR